MRRVSRDEALAEIGALSVEPNAPTPCGMCAMSNDVTHVVDANEHAVTVVAPYAARPWHLVVVLRAHVEAIAEVPQGAWLALQTLAHRAARALEAERRPRRIYVAALGSAAPRAMSFPHVHVHVVPLDDGGDADRPSAVFTWQDGVWVYDQTERDAIASRLRVVLAGC
jgi:diadenosine tetraphosphate (Ap4A) HIT family hydrolase